MDENRPYVLANPGVGLKRYEDITNRFLAELNTERNQQVEQLIVKAPEIKLGKERIMAGSRKLMVDESEIDSILRYLSPPNTKLWELKKHISFDTMTNVFSDIVSRRQNRKLKFYITGRKTWGVVSSKHALIRNCDVFSAALGAVEAADLDHAVANYSFDHGNGSLSLVLGGDFTFEAHRGDICNIGVTIFNSEIATGSLWAIANVFRLVCSNGMIMRAESLGMSDRLIHIGTKEIPTTTELTEKFMEAFNVLLNKSSIIPSIVAEASEVTLPNLEYDDLVKSVQKSYGLAKRHAKAAIENMNAIGSHTLYGLSQGLAEHATHNAGYLSPENQQNLAEIASVILTTPLVT